MNLCHVLWPMMACCPPRTSGGEPMALDPSRRHADDPRGGRVIEVDFRRHDRRLIGNRTIHLDFACDTTNSTSTTRPSYPGLLRSLPLQVSHTGTGASGLRSVSRQRSVCGSCAVRG